jgi:hypothetical protein
MLSRVLGSSLWQSSNRAGIDEATVQQVIRRAQSPYRNHRAPVLNLPAEATARNCLLETASQQIMTELAAQHRGLLERCSSNPALLPSSEFHVAPYALRLDRMQGDLFLSELTRADLRCVARCVPGSPLRLDGGGADAPYGFLLLFKEIPVAAVSYVVADGPTLFVVQTMRLRLPSPSLIDSAELKACQKAVQRLHLKEAMLALCASIASRIGCSSLTYQGAINNRWVHEVVSQGGIDGWDSICVPRMPLEQAREIYDDFCLQHGFVHDASSGNFVKRL